MKNLFILLVSSTLFSLSSLAQPTAEICLVTVDTSQTHNLVVWERANVVSTNPVDSIIIWRADPTGVYGIVGAVHFDSLSEFHDLTADPNLHSYYYAIQAKDNTGLVGPLSPIHATIHFSVVDDGTGELHLVWTPYIGHSVDAYDCWLDSLANDLFILVNSTVSNDTDWTQSNPPINFLNAWYLVDVQWTLSCESTRASHNTTRSNKSQPVAGQMNLGHNEGLSSLFMFPNPAQDNLTVKFSSLVWKDTQIEIFDLNGKRVYTSSPVKVLGQYTHDINTSDLSAGIYTIRVQNGLDAINEKLIITK